MSLLPSQMGEQHLRDLLELAMAKNRALETTLKLVQNRTNPWESGGTGSVLSQASDKSGTQSFTNDEAQQLLQTTTTEEQSRPTTSMVQRFHEKFDDFLETTMPSNSPLSHSLNFYRQEFLARLEQHSFSGSKYGNIGDGRDHGDANARSGSCTSSASYDTVMSVEIDKSRQNHSPNPFHVDAIMRKLRRYMSHSNLATARFVCTSWNELITPEFLQRSKMTLDCSSYLAQETSTWSQKLLFAYPISAFQYPDEFPPSPPSTLIVTVKPRAEHRGTQILLRWLQIYAPMITDIQIKLAGEWSYGECPPELFWQLVSYCKNLEVLRIPFPSLQPSPTPEKHSFPKITTLEIGFGGFCRRRMSFLQPVKSILGTTPNLKILRMNLVSQISEMDLLEYFGVCMEMGFLENLVELDLRKTILSTAVLEALSTYNFKCLKRLVLESYILVLSPPASTAFTALLTKLSCSLEELRIRLVLNALPLVEGEDDDEDLVEQSSTTITSIPHLECLKSLEIHSDMTTEQGSIDFIQRFPKLETLVLTEKGSPEVSARLFPEVLHFLHPTLRTLKIRNLQIQSYTLDKITRSFPQLEVLHVGLPSCSISQAMAPAVVQVGLLTLSQLSKLEELDIRCPETNEMDFNKAISKMFVDDEYNFSGLKKFSFDCENHKIVLKEKAVLKSFRNAYSLEYLELKNFLINGSEKETILDSLRKVNRVRFINCLVVDPFGELKKERRGPDHLEVISIGQTRDSHSSFEIWELETGSCTGDVRDQD